MRWRWQGLLVVFIVFLGWFIWYVGPSSEKPKLTVTVEDKIVPVMDAGGCWDIGFGITRCAQSANISHLIGEHLLEKNPVEVIVPPGSTMMIQFDRAPFKGTTRVVQWPEPVETRTLDLYVTGDNSVRLPEVPGVHIYVISAKFGRGYAHFACAIELRDNP